METTWLELGGVLVRRPVNAGTNLLLALQCTIYWLLLRQHGEEGTRGWSTFFLLMAAATAAGAVKHGFGHALAPGTYEAVLAISNVGGGLSTYFAQVATICTYARSDRQPMLRAVSYVQAVSFLGANAVLGPELSLLIANTAVGLMPVIVIEGLAARDGDPGSAAIAGGLLISALAGIAYLGDVVLGRWFDHIDLAHAVMALSFHLIRRGAVRRTPPLPSEAGSPCPT